MDDLINKQYEQLFAEIFKEYEKKLYVFIVKILRSEEVAKDILQDIFLKLWYIREQIKEIENINAFLYKMAENKVYDVLRKAANEKEAKEYLWHSVETFCTDQSEAILAREYNTIIEKAIEQLPSQRKKVYTLAKREGMKQTEIAEHMQLSPNTVRNHLTEAFRQIGVYLKQNLTSFFFF